MPDPKDLEKLKAAIAKTLMREHGIEVVDLTHASTIVTSKPGHEIYTMKATLELTPNIARAAVMTEDEKAASILAHVRCEDDHEEEDDAVLRARRNEDEDVHGNEGGNLI